MVGKTGGDLRSKAVDKTALFQAFESELRESNISTLDSPAQLDEAERDLHDYFENPSELRQALRVASLTYEYAFLRANASDPDIARVVKALIAEFREARDKNSQSFFPLWVSYLPAGARAINNMAGVARLQANCDDEIDVLAKSYFRDMGDLLEGSLQPFLRLRLDIFGMLALRKTGAGAVAGMTFGAVVQELLASATTTNAIYQPAPYGLTASQWRNIANHNSYRVSGATITCSYGTKNQQKTLSLTIEDLQHVVRHWNNVFYTHKIAREFFSIDNAQTMIQHMTSFERLEQYSHDATLAHGLFAAGFSTLFARYEPGIWTLVLDDSRGRGSAQAKAALQEAVIPYLSLNNPMEFSVNVKSGNLVHAFGFVGSLGTGRSLPTDFKGNTWSIDNFRPTKYESFE